MISTSIQSLQVSILFYLHIDLVRIMLPARAQTLQHCARNLARHWRETCATAACPLAIPEPSSRLCRHGAAWLAQKDEEGLGLGDAGVSPAAVVSLMKEDVIPFFLLDFQTEV